MAYCYDGKTYETIKEMAEEYGIDRQRIYSFRRRGWSLEDAMQMCVNDVRGRGRLFEYNGKLYRSPKALAEEYGLPWNSLAHYIQRCKTVEEAVDRCKEAQEKKIMLWGKKYQSRYEVATAFGIRETSISARIHPRNRTLEEIVLELLQKEPICFEGKSYNTLVELCAEYQVQPCNVFERLKYGKTLEEAIYLPIRIMGKDMKLSMKGKYIRMLLFYAGNIISPNEIVRGWINYFRIGMMKLFMEELGEWLRHKMRVILMKQWKRPKTIYRNLSYLNWKNKTGCNQEEIFKVANSRLGWYRRCGMNVVNFIISKDLLENRIKDGANLLNPLSYYLVKVGI